MVMQPTKQAANIEEFLWNMHTTLVAAPGPVELDKLKDQYLKHHGHKCSIERFLVVGEGGLAATLKRIPHVITVFVDNGVTFVKASQSADIDKNQLIEEDKRYRREVAKKNAAKAAAMGTSKAKAAAPPAGVSAPNDTQGKRPAEDGAGNADNKKQRNEAEVETLARMLIQGVVRVLQNRQKANKGALPMNELETEFKELWKVPFNVKQANETDPVAFLRKWPSKVEVVPQGDSFVVQLAKKGAFKSGFEEQATTAASPSAGSTEKAPEKAPEKVPEKAPEAAPAAEAKNGPAKRPGVNKVPSDIRDFLWNLHTLLHAHGGGIAIDQLKEVYFKHFGHKCTVERFLVVGEGGLQGTLKRIPHIVQIVQEPEPTLQPSLPAGITREELTAEDDKYRKSLVHKAKAGAAKAEPAKAPGPSPEGERDPKKARTDDPETLQRMLIQGVLRVLQNRVKDGKGPLPVAELDQEFEAAWKVPFNLQQAGEKDTVQFLQRWPTKVEVYRENGRDVVSLAKKPAEKAKATAVKAPPAKAGSTATTAPAPVPERPAEPAGDATLPELTQKAKSMLQSMKDLVEQQEALVKALTKLQN